MLIATALFIVHFFLIMRCFHRDYHNPSRFKQYTSHTYSFYSFNYFEWIKKIASLSFFFFISVLFRASLFHWFWVICLLVFHVLIFFSLCSSFLMFYGLLAFVGLLFSSNMEKFLSIISQKLVSVSIWEIKITYILNHLILAHMWKKVSIYFFQSFISLCFIWMDSVVCLKVHVSFTLKCMICH